MGDKQTFEQICCLNAIFKIWGGNNKNSFVAWTILVSKLGFPRRTIFLLCCEATIIVTIIHGVTLAAIQPKYGLCSTGKFMC